MTSPSDDRSHLPEPAGLNRGFLLIACLALPIIAVTLFGYRMFIAEEVEAEVIGHSWARRIGVDTLDWAQGEGRCDRIPPALKDIQKKPDDPENCTFRYTAWVETSHKEVSGNSLQPEPYWPEVETSDCTEMGCTRVGFKLERYHLTLRGPDGVEHDCKLSQEKWASLKLGSKPKGKSSLFMERIACRSFDLD